MGDISLLNEINAGKRARKTKIKYVIAFSVLIITATTGVLAHQVRQEKKSSGSTSKTSNVVETLNTEIPTSESDPTPSTSLTPTATSNVSKPSSPTADISVVTAELCKDIIDNANALNNSNNAGYHKAWEQWNVVFEGRYTTAEALEAKNWHKDYNRKLFAELVAQINPTMQGACKSTTSIAEILIQPNYDLWQ